MLPNQMLYFLVFRHLDSFDMIHVKSRPTQPFFGSHLGTLALKTENFSKKIGRFSKT